MILDCGATVWIEGIHIDRTYSGLICGVPTEEINNELMVSSQENVQRYWGTKAVYLIPPKIFIEDNEFPRLPSYCIQSLLLSNWSECGDGTELVVVIYTDKNPFSCSVRDLIFDEIQDLEWEILSEEWSF